MDLEESLLEPARGVCRSRAETRRPLLSVAATRRLVCWLLGLGCSYALQRGSCHLGVPDDCILKMDSFEMVTDITMLLVYGSMLAWFARICDKRRFQWVFSWQSWYFWAMLVGTPGVYSLISDIPWLKHDFHDIKHWGIAFTVLFSTVVVAVAGSIVFHVRSAAHSGGGWSYAAPRLALLGYAAGSAAVLSQSGHALHVHHLYLGIAIAMWADLSHPISAATLAIGAGIFLQGLAAYSFQPIALPRGCFDTPSATALECAFDAAGADFALRVCPAAGGSISHTCTEPEI